MNRFERYARAFFGALRMTLRGELPPALRVHQQYPELSAWWAGTIASVDAVIAAAEAHGVDKARRESLLLHSEKRDVSMATILGGVRFHAEREFPHLMRVNGNYNALAIYATNMNDRYLVLRLAQADELPAPVREAVEALATHLEQVPDKVA